MIRRASLTAACCFAFGILALDGCASSGRQPSAPAQPAPARAATAASPQRQVWLNMFARGYFPGRSGQLFIVPREGDFITERDPLYVFMHGSPWDYDTRIPLLFHGAPFATAVRT